MIPIVYKTNVENSMKFMLFAVACRVCCSSFVRTNHTRAQSTRKRRKKQCNIIFVLLSGYHQIHWGGSTEYEHTTAFIFPFFGLAIGIETFDISECNRCSRRKCSIQPHLASHIQIRTHFRNARKQPIRKIFTANRRYISWHASHSS